MMVTYCPKFEIPTLFGSKNIGLTNSLKKFTWSTFKVNISKTKNLEAFKLCNNVDLELINLQARNQSFMPNCLDLKKKKQSFLKKLENTAQNDALLFSGLAFLS